MRRASNILVTTVAIICLSGCGSGNPTTLPTSAPATSPASATAPAAALAGRWTGAASVVVQWVQQKQLPVRLDIAADGTVSGNVGDATLVDAKLRSGRGSIERSLGWGREYRIHGTLQGNLIDAEQIHRDAVDIVFDQQDQTTLTGGLTSSGSEIGAKESMKLTAGGMVLRRAPN